METWLKIAFWFSVVVSILGAFVLGDASPFYLLAAILVLSGIFIQQRLYRVAAIILFCADLSVAYLEHQEEYAEQMRIREAQTKMEGRL